MSRAGCRADQQGFVLVLTLWVLAAIAIAATYFAERVHAALRLAQARQGQAQALIDLASAQSEVFYRLAVTPLSPHGLGAPPMVIRLDGRAYLHEGARVELQDVAGLLNVNRAAPGSVARVLGTLGVAESRVAALVDALEDYIDPDDLRRLQGAESAQYRAAGRPDLPRNGELTAVHELHDLHGWAGQPELWGPGGIADLATVSGMPRVNPNTAPWQILVALPGVSREAARVIIERREIEPIGAAWIDRMLGTGFDTLPSPLFSFPAAAVRVTLAHPGLPWLLRYNVVLTPKGASAPWKVTDFHRLEASRPLLGPEQAPAARAVESPRPQAHAPDPPRFPPRPAESASAPSPLAP